MSKPMPESAASPDYWKKCSSCKKSIAYRALYWVCNVSTCNRKRTGLSFCSVSCWDAHVPMMNHRESWAEERKAPSFEEWEKILKGEDEPKQRKPKAEPAAASEPLPNSKEQQQQPKVILRRSSS